MSKNILIGIVLVITLGCALTIALVQHLTDGDRANTLAHRIADFDLPEGYQNIYEQRVVDFFTTALLQSVR